MWNEDDIQGQLFSCDEWEMLVGDLGLSRRQGELMYLLVHGYSDRQIGGKLGISLATVRTHISRLFQKFDLQDRVELNCLVFGKFREQCNRMDCPRNRTRCGQK
ncbi:Response regulator protein VraR [Anaerohalosphaera lusitana]|uniref:Response regulator protein VraR n=1 Tax=Anaerohalosphaera lusitana TaxID=1936003 RepID=A0A1U9NKC4_9BACT|nr:helix-turn-helix transcriptional regulator [Anaerohalosphaera lusitana]AQT68040.1 Response regulator protein VraR [Anaerohalosphaera lusitana]